MVLCRLLHQLLRLDRYFRLDLLHLLQLDLCIQLGPCSRLGRYNQLDPARHLTAQLDRMVLYFLYIRLDPLHLHLLHPLVQYHLWYPLSRLRQIQLDQLNREGLLHQCLLQYRQGQYYRSILSDRLVLLLQLGLSILLGQDDQLAQGLCFQDRSVPFLSVLLGRVPWIQDRLALYVQLGRLAL